MKKPKNLSINPQAKYFGLDVKYDHPQIILKKLEDIEEVPPIPKYCTRKLEKHCSSCPYYSNHLTLFEFGKNIDRPGFKERGYIGPLGTDSTLRCPFL